MRLIDVDALDIDAWERTSDAVCDLLDAPIIDAVPVVRCKDCLYYTPDDMSPGSGWCEDLERAEYDMHYCNYARRKACGNCKRRDTCEPFHRKNIGVFLDAGVYFTDTAIIGTTQKGGNLSLNWCDKWEREL